MSERESNRDGTSAATDEGGLWPAGVGSRLTDAGRWAIETWQVQYPGSVGNDALERSVVTLTRALTEPPEAPVDEAVRQPPSLLVVRRTLLDLMRRRFVEAFGPIADVESGQAFVSRSLRFEEVRKALEPSPDMQVEAELMGPRASEMLAEIGHDLRSPLTSVMFLSEVLREAPDIRQDESKSRQLGLIYTGALTMLNIVNNFMEMVKEGGRESDAEPTIFSLSELLESVRRTVQPMADENGLKLETGLRLEGGDRRIGFPVPMSRVLLNLVTNALKFTDEGTVRIEVSEPAPEIVDFAVVDSGPGIQPEVESRIFRVFEPSQDRHGVRFSGTGLGLVIVRRLLGTLGSELVCESTVGSGTRMSFRVRLEGP